MSFRSRAIVTLVLLAGLAGGGYLLSRGQLPFGLPAHAQSPAAAPATGATPNAGGARGGNRPGASGQAAQGAPSGNGAGGGARGRGPGGNAAVQTAVAVSQDVPITRTAIGWMEPTATVMIRPRIDGVVTEVDVTDGQTVKPGDVLFKLDDRPIRATIAKDQAQIAKDQASLDQANADLTRTQSLASRQVATQQQLEQQQATVKGLQATIQMDNATLQTDQLQLGYATIIAPIAGRVGTINTSVGNLVRAADQTAGGLLTITAMTPLRVSFSVPEQDLDLFRQALNSGADVPVQVLNAADKTVKATGKLTFIDSSVDTSSGTITVKAMFDNQDGALWPGEYVDLSSQLGVRKGLTVVPISAVQENEQGSFVYVVKTDQTVSRQPVKTTETIGEEAIIASGVNPGDHVVTEGQLNLTQGARVVETLAANRPS